MQAIGERLREARMRQGLDVTEVEVATKIRAKYLRALENDEFSMLPGKTYVKSFLRTYAEYLGLDAHLLVEEYRAQHEPRGEGEVQAYVPPAQREAERRGGPPTTFGPGTLLVGGVVLLLVIFAVIGLSSGGEKSKRSSTTAGKPGKRGHAPRKKHPAPGVLQTLRLKVVPTETTYVCVDNGKGTKLFEGTISTPRSFKGKRLRINIGRSSANLFLNGTPVHFTRTASAVGLSFSRGGRATPLPPGQRPCA